MEKDGVISKRHRKEVNKNAKKKSYQEKSFSKEGEQIPSLAAILMGCHLSLRLLISRPLPFKEWRVFLWTVFWEQRTAIRRSTLRKDGASC